MYNKENNYSEIKIKNKIILILFIIIISYGYTSKAQDSTAFWVSNAHLDTQWNWTVQTTISEYIPNTLNANFNLLKKYPSYVFNFEGGIKYMWAKEYYPKEYAQLKKFILQNRWHVSGASLDACDVNIPSPESIFRNILIGQTFYKKEFGIKSTDIFLPDCFGFGYVLPTIASHCGLIGFSTQKLTWGSAIPIPFKLGIWQGIDGSKLFSVLNAGNYVSTITDDLSNDSSLLQEIIANASQSSGHALAYRYYGTGDRGGAPDENSVNWLDKSIKGTGPVKVIAATSDSLYKLITPAQYRDFPLYNGELLMSTHGTGCYTSHAELKRWNRKCELLADATEKSAVMADWLGGLNYPKQEINDCWIHFIWHQFHDDITGTSIPQAYTFSWNDYGIVQNKLSGLLMNSVGAVTRSFNTQTSGIPLMIYNPLSTERCDIIEASLNTNAAAPMKVVGTNGKDYPVQTLSSSKGNSSVLFPAQAPSVGYAVYNLVNGTSVDTANKFLKITQNTIENQVYKVILNSNGDISSIFDKRVNKELLKSPVRISMRFDNSHTYPSWEILYSSINSAARYVDATPVITIEEQGPVRASLKVVRENIYYTLIQHIRLSAFGAVDRLDVVNDLNWSRPSTLLKAEFNLNVSNPKAAYDLGLGYIYRQSNTSSLYEVPGHQWADITSIDSSYGVSILNDCKYGWDKPNDNTLRLTLLHIPQVGNNFTYQQSQDIGHHNFTFSIFGHTGKVDERTVWQGSRLNQPLIGFVVPKHAGTIKDTFSFVKVNTDQVAVKALKKAEEGDDIIIRVYELTGHEAKNVKIIFPSQILSAKELNGIEEMKTNANFNQDTLYLQLSAFQPVTFGIKLAKPADTSESIVAMPLQLKYSNDVITSDSTRTDGHVDAQLQSYPSELIPDTIRADGIPFKMGPRTTGAKNVIRCNSDTIYLPTGNNFNKIYLLAASSQNVNNSVTFYINKIPVNIKIGYFTDFIAQHSIANLTTGYFNKVNPGFCCTHLHNGITNINEPYQFGYMFKYIIPIDSSVKYLILPHDTNTMIFAITVAKNTNDDVIAVKELMDVPSYPEIKEDSACSGLVSQGVKVSASGTCDVTSENPALAVDGNVLTKWCHNIVGPKWLMIDLGSEKEICRWKVIHAGIEGNGYITKDFYLQMKNSFNQWINIDSVLGNTLNITDRELNSSFNARYVRLYITNSGTDNASRIYEFQLFNDKVTGIDEKIIPDLSGKFDFIVYPNPTKDKIYIQNLILGNQEIIITDLLGKIVLNDNVKSNALTSQTIDVSSLRRGVYFIKIINNEKCMTKKFLKI